MNYNFPTATLYLNHVKEDIGLGVDNVLLCTYGYQSVQKEEVLEGQFEFVASELVKFLTENNTGYKIGYLESDGVVYQVAAVPVMTSPANQ